MQDLVAALNAHDALQIVWRAVAWACVVFLLCVGVLVFVRPATANRFFSGFVASPRVNFLEAALRLLAGFAFMGVSPATKLPALFFWFGALLAATAIAMMFLFGAHRRYADRVLPLVKRFLPLYGGLALALGGFIAWALI